MTIQTELATNGYVDLGVYQPARSGMVVAELLAQKLGVKVNKMPEVLNVNSMEDKPKNTYAGNYGSGKLPLHTDLAHWHIPPRFLMLRCIVGDPNVSTLFVHYCEIVKGLSPLAVQRAMFRPRRRLDGKMFMLRLRDRGIFRWDQLFLIPENREAEMVQNHVISRQEAFNVVKFTLSEPGRTVVIDNWNALHGRSAVEINPSPRRIERIYFAEE